MGVYILSSIQLCFRKTQSIIWKGVIHVGIIKEGVICFGFVCCFFFPPCSFVIINLTFFRLRHKFWLGWPHTLNMLLLSLCACLQYTKKKSACWKYQLLQVNVHTSMLCNTALGSGSSQSPGSSLVPLQLVWAGTSQLLLGLQLFVQN